MSSHQLLHHQVKCSAQIIKYIKRQRLLFLIACRLLVCLQYVSLIKSPFFCIYFLLISTWKKYQCNLVGCLIILPKHFYILKGYYAQNIVSELMK